jgi:hypothetical protein
MTTLLLALLLALFVTGAGLLILGLCRAAGLASRGEVAGAPSDDWMDIADVVSDDHHPDDCDCTDISLEGVTDRDAGVLRRNWMALTDGERTELNEAFDAIVEGADR